MVVDIQHSLAAHFAFPFWGPQLPAKATETSERRAKAEKRIMTMIILFEIIGDEASGLSKRDRVDEKM
jgi:hypothetical protein